MSSNSKKLLELESLPFRPYFTGALIVNALMILWGIAVQKFLPPEIPLFYGVAEGENQLARSIFIFLPNIFALIILVANIFIAHLTTEEFFKKILIVAGIIATFFATITTIKVSFLIGSF
jgi:hypothetical protein